MGVIVGERRVDVGDVEPETLCEFPGPLLAVAVPNSVVHVEDGYPPPFDSRLAAERVVRDDPRMIRVRCVDVPVSRHLTGR
jgi:hypothetical protein